MSSNRLRCGITSDAGKRLHDWAVSHGWNGELTKGNHVRYTHPKVPRCVFNSLTTGDKRSFMNCRSNMRKLMRQHGVAEC